LSDGGATGRLFIVSGPSGVGKSTLVQRLLKLDPALKFSISYTTRPQRPGEENGVHYHFVDNTTFKQMLARGAFIEHARYNNNWYGTPIEPIQEWVSQGRKVILEIEVQGAEQLKARQAALGIPMCFIFILPPSFEHLKQRIEHRGTESAAKRQSRLEIARQELEKADAFEVRIVNQDVELALGQLRNAVVSNCGKIEQLN